MTFLTMVDTSTEAAFLAELLALFLRWRAIVGVWYL